MSHARQPKSTIGILAFAILGLGGLLIAWSFAQPGSPNAIPDQAWLEGDDHGVPLVEWDPNELVVTLTPDATTARRVTASLVPRISTTFPHAIESASVTPALTPYVEVESVPSSALHARRFDLTFSIPPGEALQTIEGALVPQIGSGKATALPVTLNIWPEAEVPGEADLRFSYPPGMTKLILPNEGSITVVAFADGSGAGFNVLIEDEYPDGSSTTDWADDQTWPFTDDWRARFELATVGGVTALEDPLTGSVIFRRHETTYRFGNGLGREDAVLVDRSAFDAVVASVRFVDP